MRDIKIHFLFLATIFFGFACNKKLPESLTYPFKVIPQPQKVEILNGKGLDFAELTMIDISKIGKKPVLGEILSKLKETNAQGKEVLSLMIDPELEETEDPEGYVLTVQNGKVIIKSTGASVIFYGCQTLEQLL